MARMNRREDRRLRHRRVRSKISGTADRPRMSVMKSSRQIYVQFIDDEAGRTLASVSTAGQDGGRNMEAAASLGRRAAEAALGRGIRRVVVDRGGHLYHGRVKAIVDAAVEAGLSIRSHEPARETAAAKEEA